MVKDPLFDEDGDHIYTAVVPFYQNGGHVEYKYTINGWGSASGAIIGSECDFNLKMEMIIMDFSLKMKTLNFLPTYLVVAAM